MFRLHNTIKCQVLNRGGLVLPEDSKYNRPLPGTADAAVNRIEVCSSTAGQRRTYFIPLCGLRVFAIFSRTVADTAGQRGNNRDNDAALYVRK